MEYKAEVADENLFNEEYNDFYRPETNSYIQITSDTFIQPATKVYRSYCKEKFHVQNCAGGCANRFNFSWQSWTSNSSSFFIIMRSYFCNLPIGITIIFPYLSLNT